MMRTVLVVSAVLFGGCASMYGTPAELAAKASAMSSYTLCSRLAAATLAPSEVRESWAMELQRRGENCGQFASLLRSEAASNQQQLDLGLRLMGGTQAAQPVAGPTIGGSTPEVPAFLKRSELSGLNRICYYDRAGSVVAITVRNVDLCPQLLRQ